MEKARLSPKRWRKLFGRSQKAPNAQRGNISGTASLQARRLTSFAGTSMKDGQRVGAPFDISESWIKHMVLRDPNFDCSTRSYNDFAWVFAQDKSRLGWLIDTDDPDLSRFRDAGGKLLTFHGLTDQYISVGGSIQYRQSVEDEMGGVEAIDDFYRLFLAPGVGHCGLLPSPGPVPLNPLATLVTWVEEGKAPDVLRAVSMNKEGGLAERDICRFPYAQYYTGKDWKTPSGWACSGDVMAGLNKADANLDSVSWHVPLPVPLPGKPGGFEWFNWAPGLGKKNEL